MKRALGIAALLVLLVIGWSAVRSGGEAPRTKGGRDQVAEPARAPRVRQGGKADGEDPSADDPSRKEPARKRRSPPPRGVVVADPHPVNPMEQQAGANQKSIEEAKETGKYPERLDPKVAPAPFDREAWDRDPQAYLDVVEPGRVWQTADESSGLEPLEADGDVNETAEPGGVVKLAVRGDPLSPVTFTVMGSGQLDNGLTSITVRTDAVGYARAMFTLPSGAPESTVVAGSPRATGQVNFTVRVRDR